ncbi:hypothetical protein J3R73_003486 [Labrys monachus]|uniref:Transposase n=1 Tax=Labrys monachus TaxID=217067 RepID=A0ABU0FGG0_9HYPH|nr:hypothetical protein [Labrys monachus]
MYIDRAGLRVSNLEGMILFFQQVIGLEILSRTEQDAVLGIGGPAFSNWGGPLAGRLLRRVRRAFVISPSRCRRGGILLKKGRGAAARLCHMGHVLMENRHGLIVDTELTLATGTAEREAALSMLGRRNVRHRITVAADKAYDVAGFVADLRKIKVTPHVAQNTTNRRSESWLGKNGQDR